MHTRHTMQGTDLARSGTDRGVKRTASRAMLANGGYRRTTSAFACWQPWPGRPPPLTPQPQDHQGFSTTHPTPKRTHRSYSNLVVAVTVFCSRHLPKTAVAMVRRSPLPSASSSADSEESPEAESAISSEASSAPSSRLSCNSSASSATDDQLNCNSSACSISSSSEGTDSASESEDSQAPVWEMCCAVDSRLARECRKEGLTAQRLTLETGFDFSRSHASKKAISRGRKRPPTRAWCSPPCTAWSSLQNFNQKTAKQKRALKRKRRNSRRLVQNCVKVLLWVVSQGGHFYYEWPKSCQGWAIPELKQLRKVLKDRGLDSYYFDIDGCSYGLRSVDQEGFLWKRWQILTSDRDFQKCSRQCPGGHSHIKIQGKETAQSAFYPPSMCQAIAQYWAGHL